MPVITIEAGRMDKEKKAKLVETFTKSASEILGIPEQAFVTLIRENDADNVGNGGKLLSDIMAERK
ncbi:4-oxalocrotonate tautomerase [Clostridium bovifaecis]|uniref:4-oxalocrotonate tautomerase n=1 Tax=Clostridium bovifaecis TaxID=2184719 RepID=A0A6I6EPR6_9CLOT|nr:4-oxalocrotonate tautomerase [Clostridium bovifaecis]